MFSIGRSHLHTALRHNKRFAATVLHKYIASRIQFSTNGSRTIFVNFECTIASRQCFSCYRLSSNRICLNQTTGSIKQNASTISHVPYINQTIGYTKLAIFRGNSSLV